VGQNSTNLFLAYSTKKVERDYLRTFVVLTDGAVFDKKGTVRLIERFREDVTVHCLGIIGADLDLVKQIAIAGNGTSAFTSSNNVDTEMFKVGNSVLDIFFRSVKFHLPDNYQQFPEEVSPVRLGRRLLVFGVTEKSAHDLSNLTIEYKDPFGNIKNLKIENTRVVKTNFLSKLAALQRIRELECIESTRTQQSIIDEIKSLGIKYQLATEYTAFVAVHENKEENKTEETMKKENVNENFEVIEELEEKVQSESRSRKKKCKRVTIKAKTYEFDAYIHLFKADGSWDISVMGYVVEISDAYIQHKMPNVEASVWLVALMVVYMSKKFGEEVLLILKKNETIYWQIL